MAILTQTLGPSQTFSVVIPENNKLSIINLLLIGAGGGSNTDFTGNIYTNAGEKQWYGSGGGGAGAWAFIGDVILPEVDYSRTLYLSCGSALTSPTQNTPSTLYIDSLEIAKATAGYRASGRSGGSGGVASAFDFSGNIVLLDGGTGGLGGQGNTGNQATLGQSVGKPGEPAGSTINFYQRLPASFYISTGINHGSISGLIGGAGGGASGYRAYASQGYWSYIGAAGGAGAEQGGGNGAYVGNPGNSYFITVPGNNRNSNYPVFYSGGSNPTYWGAGAGGGVNNNVGSSLAYIEYEIYQEFDGTIEDSFATVSGWDSLGGVEVPTLSRQLTISFNDPFADFSLSNITSVIPNNSQFSNLLKVNDSTYNVTISVPNLLYFENAYFYLSRTLPSGTSAKQKVYYRLVSIDNKGLSIFNSNNQTYTIRPNLTTWSFVSRGSLSAYQSLDVTIASLPFSEYEVVSDFVNTPFSQESNELSFSIANDNINIVNDNTPCLYTVFGR